MRAILKTSFAAFALSSALAGVALADSYYPGIDPHHPPGTQNRGTMVVPVAPSPYVVDRMRTRSVYVDPTPTGSVYVDPMPSGSVYVDPMPTGSVYVDPMPTGSIYAVPAPRRIYLTPSEFRERQRNEYHSGGEGDYYQGIVPPAPVP